MEISKTWAFRGLFGLIVVLAMFTYSCGSGDGGPGTVTDNGGTCTPNCWARTRISLNWNKECGSNGCGGSCGTCDSGKTCNQDGKCVSGNSNPCGNGICDAGETTATCPADCKASAVCGDGRCDLNTGETCSSCAQDCGECMDDNCTQNTDCNSKNCFDMSAGLPNPVDIGFCSQDCSSQPCSAGFVCDGTFHQCFKSCQSIYDCYSQQDCFDKECARIKGVIGPDTYTLKVDVKASGSWDAFGGQPDFTIVLRGKDGVWIGGQGPVQDSMNANFSIDVPNWYLGHITVSLYDKDISLNDYIWQDKDLTDDFMAVYVFGSSSFKPFTYTKPDNSASATVSYSIYKQ